MKRIVLNSAVSRLTLIFTFLFVSGLVQSTSAQELITIRQAIEETLNNNLQVKQSKLSESLMRT
jgi:outer membrane protein